MCESTFVVRSSSPFALSHANLHLLLIHPNAVHIPFKLLCTLAMQYAVRRLTYSLNESLCRIIWWRRRRWTIGRAKRKMDYVNCVLGALASHNSYLLSNERIKKTKKKMKPALPSFLISIAATQFTVDRVRCARLPYPFHSRIWIFYEKFSFQFLFASEKQSSFFLFLHGFKYVHTKLICDFSSVTFCAAQFVCSCIN